MKTHMLAAAILLGTSSLAAASDSVSIVEGGAYDWSGVYVGAQVGYGWGDATSFFLPADSWELEPNGAEGGIYLGFNHQTASGLVFGLETDININGNSDKAPYLVNGQVFNYAEYWQGEADLNWSGSARVRVGYAIDRLLPYVTAGVAYADYDFTTYWDNGAVYDKGSSNLLGWTVGAGAEYAINDNWRVRASYAYTKYNKDTFHSYLPTGDLSVTYDFDMKKHDLKLGISYNW